MSKPKLKVKEVFAIKDKNGHERHLIKTTISTDGPPCKNCHKGQREAGSSRCADCRSKHVLQGVNDRRLQSKINSQVNKSSNE